MKKALLLALFSLAIFPIDNSLVAQDSNWRVLPDSVPYADNEIMLLKHLQRIAPAVAWEHDTEFANTKTEQDFKAYRDKLLDNFGKSLGLPFPERTPLNARTVRTLQRGSYRIENVLFESQPGIPVTANLYVPQDGPGPWPAILVSCGHSKNGKAYDLYHSVGLGLVAKGYVALVYDPFGEGERYQYLDDNGEKLFPSPTREHTMSANPLFLMGSHLMALRCWDGIRALDYLCSRPEVDTTRIGMTGNSGGGTVTLHLAPIDERIKVVVAAGTVSGPELALGTGSISDGEQNLPLQLPLKITHADLIAACWPRPYRLIKESAEGVRTPSLRSWVQASWLYDTLGTPDKMSWVETERPHGYFREMREPMYQWFGRWFYDRKDDGTEPKLKLEPEDSLLVSSSGQILMETGTPLWQWASERLDSVLPEREVPRNSGELSSLRNTLTGDIRTLMGNPSPQSTPVADNLGMVVNSAVTAEKLAIYSENDIYLPALLFKPAGKEQAPAIVIADSRGKTSDNLNLARSLAEDGSAVLIVDLRGYGETAISISGVRDSLGGYESQLLGAMAGAAYDGLKLGRPVFAQRVFDLNRAVEYLRGRGDIDPGRIALLGRKSCGMHALYAAALDSRIAGVITDSSLVSWSALVSSKLYTWHFADFLPRVLTSHDLPQLAGILAPRPVWILNPLDAVKKTVDRQTLRNNYRWTMDTYTKAKAGKQFFIGTYSSPDEFNGIVSGWAEMVF